MSTPSKEKRLETELQQSVLEELTIQVTGFGKWQCLLQLVLSLLMVAQSMNTYVSLFYAPPHLSYWCQPPDGTWDVDEWIRLSHVGGTRWRIKHDDQDISRCMIYDLNYTTLAKGKDYERVSKVNVSLVECAHLAYSDNYGATVVAEWDLVCDDDPNIRKAPILFRVGIMIGLLLFGVLSDSYGRKKILFGSACCQPVAGVLIASSPSLHFLLFGRFFYGVALGGTGSTAFVILTEIASNRRRSLSSGLFCVCAGCGIMLLPAVASVVNDWREFQLSISVPVIAILFFVRFIPESPQWLLCKEQTQKAERVLRKAAYMNNLLLPSTFKIHFLLHTTAPLNPLVQQEHLWHVRHHNHLRKLIVGLCLLWCVGSFSNTVLILQYCQEEENDLYASTALTGAVSITAMLMTLFGVVRFGHQKTLCFGIFLSGCFACLAAMFYTGPPYQLDHPMMLLFVTSLFFSTMALATLWNYSCRCYPTSIRGSCFGLTLSFGQLGSLLSPVVLDNLASTPTVAKVTLFVLLMVTCLVLVVWLPVTHGRELPDTIRDAELINTVTKPLRWTHKRPQSATIEETEIRIIDLENAPSLKSLKN